MRFLALPYHHSPHEWLQDQILHWGSRLGVLCTASADRKPGHSPTETVGSLRPGTLCLQYHPMALDSVSQRLKTEYSLMCPSTLEADVNNQDQL